MKKRKEKHLIIYIFICLIITGLFYYLFSQKKEIVEKLICIPSSNLTIEMLGDEIVFLNNETEYSEDGINIIDSCNHTLEYEIESNVINYKEGFYQVKYIINKTNEQIIRNVIITNDNISNVDELSNYITSFLDTYNNTISIGYYELNSTDTYLYNENKVYYGASLIKALEALYIYEYDELSEENKELASLAVSISDNDAHKKLQNNIGFQNVQDFGFSLGAKYTLTGGDTFGMTNVNDQYLYYKELYNYITTHDNGEELASYFINDYYDYTSLNNDVKLLHKYGQWDEVFHISSLFMEDEYPYILIILSNNYYYDNDPELFRDISNKINILHNLNIINYKNQHN